MKRICSLCIFVMLFLVFSSVSFANGGESNESNTNKTYFIAFQSTIDKGIVKANGGEVKRQYKYMPVVAAKLPDKAVQALSKNPKIAYIEEDGKVQVTEQEVPWGISHIKSTNVQQIGFSGAGVKVGILDTGIDYTHEDLKVSGGVSFIQGTSDFMDDNKHGTHVAGTVAALNNSLGVIGVAPQAELYAIKVLDQYGNGDYSDVIAGIEWAISNNLNILNMSLGGTKGSKTLEKAVDNAYNSGILLVASAGNRGYINKDTISYPAAYDSVIAVGAIDDQNIRANFSSGGRDLELVAPGLEIQSTVPGGYGYDNGTSMAAPHVTGIASLVLEANPNLSNIDLRSVLNKTAINLGDSFSYGNGLIDGNSAVNYAKSISLQLSK